MWVLYAVCDTYGVSKPHASGALHLHCAKLRLASAGCLTGFLQHVISSEVEPCNMRSFHVTAPLDVTLIFAFNHLLVPVEEVVPRLPIFRKFDGRCGNMKHINSPLDKEPVFVLCTEE